MNSSNDSKMPEKQQMGESGQRAEQQEASSSHHTSTIEKNGGDGQFQENEQIAADGKNSNMVVCDKCQCIVFRRRTAQFQRGPSMELPLAYQKRAAKVDHVEQQVQTEPHDQWWTVEDMFAFENVGFTHSFRGYKFLACANCEIGPIGVVCPESGKFMVAVRRVLHI